MALSDTTVRQARLTGNDYSLGDTDGLTLNVTARGGKIWYFRYYWAGKQKRMSLGSYPQISLNEARGRRDEARAGPKACYFIRHPRQPKLPSATVAISLQAEHEPAWKLPRQRSDGAVVSQPENGMGTDLGLHERFVGTAGYRPVFDTEVQLATAALVQRRASACGCRGKTQHSVRDQLTTALATHLNAKIISLRLLTRKPLR